MQDISLPDDVVLYVYSSVPHVRELVNSYTPLTEDFLRRKVTVLRRLVQRAILELEYRGAFESVTIPSIGSYRIVGKDLVFNDAAILAFSLY